MKTRQTCINPTRRPLRRLRALIGLTAALAWPALAGGHVHNRSFEWNDHQSGWPTEPGHWAGDQATFTANPGAVLPPHGSRVLQFIAAGPAGPGGGTLSQVVQLSELSEHAGVIGAGRAIVHATARFNRVSGPASDDQFLLRVRAYAGATATFPDQIADQTDLDRAVGVLFADPDADSWEDVDVFLALPAETDFAAVELGAKENVVNDTDGAEFGGHFADEVRFHVFDSATFDLTGDGVVDAVDAALLVTAWSDCDGCNADLNGDGIVDSVDLGLMLAAAPIDGCEDDADADGVPDCLDGCPDDPEKILPGACGCGEPETESCGGVGGSELGAWINAPSAYGLNSGLDLIFELAADAPGNASEVLFQVWSTSSQSIEAAVLDTTSPFIYPANALGTVTPGPGEVQALVRDANANILGVVTAPIEFVEGDGSTGDCPTDLNQDGSTEVADLLFLVTEWGANNSAADVTQDGVVDFADFLALLSAWGVCGCDTPGLDSDGDMVNDCEDGCPDDPWKTAPGSCGCGVPDDDRDGDGIPDCDDGCPEDPAKTAPGLCGCGVSDVDSDGDGRPDCTDPCPDDPCGCDECGDAGWTVFTPAADTRLIYVSSSGSDAAGSWYAPTDPAVGSDPFQPSGAIQPYRTIAAAYEALRDGHADWLLLRRGDVWQESLGTWKKSGQDLAFPMLIGSYGTGPRPAP